MFVLDSVQIQFEPKFKFQFFLLLPHLIDQTKDDVLNSCNQKQRPATLLKKRLWYRCFPVNFEKFLRTPSLQNTSGGCYCELNIAILCYYWISFSSLYIYLKETFPPQNIFHSLFYLKINHHNRMKISKNFYFSIQNYDIILL